MPATFAGSATAGRILPAMLPSPGYPYFRTVPIPSGWVQMGDAWVLWWGWRQVANVAPDKEHGVRVHLNARKMWQTKNVRAASIAQGKRFAERWCAARLCSNLPLREAVAKLTNPTPIELPPPLPSLPPTREQLQQARRLAEAGTTELERVKEALEPRKPPAQVKPRARDPMKARVIAANESLRRRV